MKTIPLITKHDKEIYNSVKTGTVAYDFCFGIHISSSLYKYKRRKHSKPIYSDHLTKR
jgi:hypothetical protein